MHARKRRILAISAPTAAVAALFLGLAVSSPSVAQVAGRPAGKGAAATPAGSKAATGAADPARKAAPADPAARRTAQVQTEAAVPPKRVVSPEDEKKMEDLLLRWEKKSASVDSLSAKYKRLDESKLFEPKKYEGQAMLKRGGLAYLDFWEVADGKTTKTFDERIVCDGLNVYQFKGPTKQIFVFPLAKDQRQKALDQGAMPFLFDMKVAKAKARYDMEFEKETETAYFIRIIPREQIDRDEYTEARIRLSKERLLPEAIRLTSPNGKETKTFTFAPDALKTNSPIAESWFDGPGMVSGLAKNKWTVVYNPGPDGRSQGEPPAPAIGTRPAPAAPAGRTATKAQAGGVRQK